jgi:hypothetical protein
MQRSTERILTTHAGSLPRPDDLVRMMWDKLDEKPVDAVKLAARVKDAVSEVVAKQIEAGIDIISDGEMSKVGFSNYVIERYTGFANRATFVATDVGNFPGIIKNCSSRTKADGTSSCRTSKGPIAIARPQAVKTDIENFKKALGRPAAGERVHRRGDARANAVQFPEPLLPERRGLSRSRRNGARRRIPRDRRCRIQPAARCAGPRDARALLHRRQGPGGHEALRPDGDRGDECGDQGAAARQGSGCTCAGATTPGRTITTSN